MVVAIFMLGLGTGGYVVGAWADRRYLGQPESLVRTYGHFELLVGLMGLSDCHAKTEGRIELPESS